MKALAERECSELFVLQQTKCISTREILKQCHIHIASVQPYVEPRPVAMGWQMPPLGNRMPAFCHPWEFFAISYCCFIFVAKERFPEI